MKHWVALLRGVNVGGRTIRMAELRSALEEAGLQNVETILQSGNVRFDSPDDAARLKDRLEKTLRERFGYDAKVQVVERDQLNRIVEAYPFGKADASRHDYVIFLERGLERDLAGEEVELGAQELVAAGDGVVYWRVDEGSTLKTNFAKLLTKAKYRDFNTNRNLNTLRKLL
ncbi:MAG: DUF1697 domain-containing protein [Chloroflexi bacterium]|nr:MAG: DUF1697 domain-containing protein [Chloroflexota bacterium]